MKLILSSYLVIAIITCSDSITKKESAPEVFEGTTPCSNIIRPLHKITEEPDCILQECHCIMVEWKLTLYKDPSTHAPTTYKLTGINRYSVNETNMYSEPGIKTESEGNWIIIHGSKINPSSVLYRLNPDKPKISLDLVKLTDNLIHILDGEGNLMIGNEFHSYTLNRKTNNKIYE